MIHSVRSVSLCLALMAGMFACALCSSALGETTVQALVEKSLPVAEFDLTKGAIVVGKSPVRVACFLVDYSTSMNAPYDGKDSSGGKLSRWGWLKIRVRKLLEDLRSKSPDVEVRVRFFAGTTIPGQNGIPDELSCVSLAGNAVETIMDQFPVQPPTGNQTAFFQATSEACDNLMRSGGAHRGGDVDWLLFVLVSDGEDTESPAEFKSGPRGWESKLEKLRESVSGVRTGVLAIGNVAEKMFSEKRFGSLVGIEQTMQIPIVRERFELSVSAKNRAGFAVGALEKSTTYRIPILIRGALNPSLGFEVAIVDSPAFEQVGLATVGADGHGQVLVRARAETDVLAGAPLTVGLRVNPKSQSSGAGPIVSGQPMQSYRFRAMSVPLDPAKWAVRGPKFVRAGAEAKFSIDRPDQDTGIRWQFKRSGVDSGVPVVDDWNPIRTFTEAGSWSVDISSISADGISSPVRKGVLNFEVVDAAFEIFGASVINLRKPARFTVKKLGASSAEYEWFVNGQPQSKGETFEWSPLTLGTFTISCEATNVPSQFKWFASGLAVKSQMVADAIIVAPDSFIEGQSEFRVDCRVYDVDSVQFAVDGVQMPDRKVAYDNAEVRIANIDFNVPLAQIRDAAMKGGLIKVELIGKKDGRPVSTDSRAIALRDATIVLKPTSQSPVANQALEFGKSIEYGLQVVGLLPDSTRAMRVEIEVVDAKGTAITQRVFAQVADGIARFGFMADSKRHSGSVVIRARVLSDALFKERKFEPVATHPLILAAAEYSVTVDGKAFAFEPIQFHVTGIQEGDSVSWEVARDGVAPLMWKDAKAMVASPSGFAPGRCTARATVTRIDGVTTVAIPAVDVVIESSVQIGLDGSWIWQSGNAPPKYPVRIDGRAPEMQELADVLWKGATAVASTPLIAELEWTPEGCDLPASVSVGVSFRYRGEGSSALPVALSKSVPLRVEPATLEQPIELTVGGTPTRGSGGGAMAFAPPTMKGVECVGYREFRMTYEPDELATRRGQTPIASELFVVGTGRTIAPEQTGVWKVEVWTRTPGESSRRLVDTSNFTVLRQLNVWEFIVFTSLFVVGALLLFWIGCCRNEPLWQRVSFGSSRIKAANGGEYEVCPCIWPKKTGPRFDIFFTKRATCKLFGDDYSPISSSALRRADWQWISAIDGSRADIEWQGGGGRNPRVCDESRRFAEPEIEETSYQRNQVWKFAPKGPLRKEQSTAIYMCVSELSAPLRFVPTFCGIVAALGLLAGVFYGFLFIL